MEKVIKKEILEAVQPSCFCATEVPIAEYKGHVISLKISRDIDDTEDFEPLYQKAFDKFMKQEQ